MALWLVLSLFALLASSQPVPSRNYDFSAQFINDTTFYYRLFWTAQTNGRIRIAIVCNSPGYCAIGWSINGGMLNSDAVIGSVDGNGVARAEDYFLKGRVEPRNGTCPNAVCSEANLNNGLAFCRNSVSNVIGQRVGAYMVIEFERPLNASDECDNDVVDYGATIWAMGSGFVPDGILQHTVREFFLAGNGPNWRGVLPTTSQPTTGVATTAVATTRQATTGQTSTGQATTGQATTSQATTAQGSVLPETTVIATTALATTGQETTGQVEATTGAVLETGNNIDSPTSTDSLNIVAAIIIPIVVCLFIALLIVVELWRRAVRKKQAKEAGAEVKLGRVSQKSVEQGKADLNEKGDPSSSSDLEESSEEEKQRSVSSSSSSSKSESDSEDEKKRKDSD